MLNTDKEIIRSLAADVAEIAALPVQEEKRDLWDPTAIWLVVENVRFTLADRPDYMHRLLTRITEGYMKMVDQLDEKGLCWILSSI